MAITDKELQSLRAIFRLSPRETQILGLILEGVSTNKDLAARLALRLPTVKVHVHSLLLKVGGTDKLQAAIPCLREVGRLDAPPKKN